jgi:hypothetical protein
MVTKTKRKSSNTLEFFTVLWCVGIVGCTVGVAIINFHDFKMIVLGACFYYLIQSVFRIWRKKAKE